VETIHHFSTILLFWRKRKTKLKTPSFYDNFFFSQWEWGVFKRKKIFLIIGKKFDYRYTQTFYSTILIEETIIQEKLLF